jgi:methanogenic corrinoid protein MtbC1
LEKPLVVIFAGRVFEVVDLGTNIPADKFVEAGKKHHHKWW